MSNIYLLLGPEEGDKKDKINEIRKSVFEKYPDAEDENFFTSDDSPDTILQALRQPSLFSSYRIVTINHLELVKKESALVKGLKEYIKNPEEDVCLIMISLESTSFLTPAEEKKIEKIIFYELFESDKIAWIKSTFRSFSFAVTDDAIEEILSSVENNKAEMKSLIELISSYYRTKSAEKKVIDSDDVASIIARKKGENGYTLFKAIAKRDLESSLMILSSIALNDPARLIGTLLTLTSEFRVAENALELRKKGLSEKEIQSQAHGISTGVFSSRGYNFRRREGINLALRNYSEKEIERIIIALIKADNDLKRASGDAEDYFKDLIYSIVVNGGEEKAASLYIPLETKLVKDSLSNA